MADYTSKADGDFNADGQTTWNEAGHPDGADDTATITHAITASAGITCGAITINAGGSLDTGTAAATITSITTASTGACTIGSGGCTFAGVLNNAGTETLTINGACTGITTFTTSNCNMNADVACELFVVDAGETFTMDDGVSLTGMTGACLINGTWVVGAGCAITSATTGGNLSGNVSGTLIVNGTAENRTVFSSVGNYLNLQDFVRINCVYADFPKARRLYVHTAHSSAQIRFADVDAEMGVGGEDGIRLQSTGAVVLLERCYISKFQYGISIRTAGVVICRDVTIGADRDGNSQPSVYADIHGLYNCPLLLGNRVRCLSTTPVSATPPEMYVDNWGCSSNGGTAGTGYSNGRFGSITRSTDNPPSGATYHARLTPLSPVHTSTPLEFAVAVPIESGDNISVTAKASRSTTDITAACADCVIDPEGAWFTPTTVAWNLTNADTYYDLPTCEATGAGGTGAKGTVRVAFRLKEYSAGDFLDIGDITITCGGTAYAVSCQNWANGLPFVDGFPSDADIAEAVWTYAGAEGRSLTE